MSYFKFNRNLAYPQPNQSFVIQGQRNGILKARDAMPVKDINSTGDSDFSVDRAKYSHIHKFVPPQPITAATEQYNSRILFDHMGRRTVSVINSATSNANGMKKWYGNRDASQIIANRRTNSVGQGSINTVAGNSISFMTKNDHNATREAKKRARCGGAATPAKCSHKYAGAPVFY
jgi:hypothetical protein